MITVPNSRGHTNVRFALDANVGSASRVKERLKQGRRLLVLHIFVKKTQATPRAAIETALKRLKATK